jgi:GTP pyrophosphokinase
MTSAVPNVVPQEPPRAPAAVRPAPVSPPAAQPPRIAPARVRARLARLGGTRHPNRAPMLEPLFRVVRATHPKADLGMIERAYRTAEKYDKKKLK